MQYYNKLGLSYLYSFILQAKSIESLDCLAGVICIEIVDKAIAKALTWNTTNLSQVNYYS